MTKHALSLGLAALLAAATAASLPAIAQTATAQTSNESGADMILVRQDIMGLQLGTMIGLKNAIDAKVDVKSFAGRAEALARSGKLIPILYPKGSDIGHPNRALPSVWSDRAGFEKAAANFSEAAGKMAVLAKAGDASGFAAQWEATGETCNACHKNFRAKDYSAR